MYTDRIPAPCHLGLAGCPRWSVLELLEWVEAGCPLPAKQPEPREVELALIHFPPANALDRAARAQRLVPPLVDVERHARIRAYAGSFESRTLNPHVSRRSLSRRTADKHRHETAP